MESKTQQGKSATLRSYGIGALFVSLLTGGIAFAQDTETADPSSPETIAISIDNQKDAAARQQTAKTLQRLGVKLDWQKATLAELKKTRTDLIAAGDDEDMRLRIILAARLRELGVMVNWRRYTSDALMDKYTAAQDAASQNGEQIAEAQEPAPAPAPRQRTSRNSRRDSNVTYELPPGQPAQPVSDPGPILEDNTVYYTPQYVQPAFPVIIQTVTPTVNGYCPPRYGQTNTIVTHDGLTVTTTGPMYRFDRNNPNCNPNDNRVVQRIQPGMPINPNALKPIIPRALQPISPRATQPIMPFPNTDPDKRQ